MSNSVRLWQRKGYYYYAYIYINTRTASGTITKRLGFFTYHLIRFIYGDDALKDMAMDYTPMGDR